MIDANEQTTSYITVSVVASELTEHLFNTESKLQSTHSAQCTTSMATVLHRYAIVSDASTQLPNQTVHTICMHNNQFHPNHQHSTLVFGRLCCTICLQAADSLLLSEILYCLPLPN
jgi:hypothetical protein